MHFKFQGEEEKVTNLYCIRNLKVTDPSHPRDRHATSLVKTQQAPR